MVDILILRDTLYDSNGCDCCGDDIANIYQAYVDGEKVNHNGTPYEEEMALLEAILSVKDKLGLTIEVRDGEW